VISACTTNIAPRSIEEAHPQAILKAFQKYKEVGASSKLIIVVDMRQHSREKRLYVYNVDTGLVVLRTRVAHGKNSAATDKGFANKFSNNFMSKQSSLGAMLTGVQYVGKHGKSIRLKGLEPGINDNVEKRCIVIHSADYVSDEWVRANGRAGLSWGCLAVSKETMKYLLENTPQNTFLYVFY
jgi:hypothetical protein